MRIILLVSCVLLTPLLLFGGDLKKVAKKFEKGDHEKTYEQIRKSLTDDPGHPGIKYYYARLFLESSYQHNNLDSARIYILQGLEDYDRITEDQAEDMLREELTQDDLTALHADITDRSFNRAKSKNTVDGWNQFLANFPGAPQTRQVLDARDDLIFRPIQKMPVIEDLEQFIGQYPGSTFRNRAKVMLDSLLVLKHQEQDSRENLETFLAENADSEFAEEAASHLLRLSTLSGAVEDFIAFARRYAHYEAGQIAVEWAFHLDKESGFRRAEEIIGLHRNSDSLSRVMANEVKFHFVIYEGGMQLVDLKGKKTRTAYEQMDQEFVCYGVSGDYLSGRDSAGPMITSFSGKTLFRGELIKNLGKGLLLARAKDKIVVIHKNGRVILSDIEDAELLDGKFLNVKKDEKFGLRSLLGEELAPAIFDDIFLVGNFWVFQKEGLFAISRPNEIVGAFNQTLRLDFMMDDYERITDDQLLGFMENEECLINSSRQYLVNWGLHEIYPDERKGYVKTSSGYFLYRSPGEKFLSIESSKNMQLRLLPDSTRQLVSYRSGLNIATKEPIRLIGDSFAWLPESSQLIFGNGRKQIIGQDDVPQMLNNELQFLLVRNARTRTLYDERGEQILTGNFENVALLSDTLLSVFIKNKFGLFGLSGRELLGPRYDHLILEGKMVTTLQGGKIGGYDLTTGRLISPKYSARIEKLGSYYLTRAQGLYGLIDADEKEIVPFEYDQITAWSDTLVWGQKGDQYDLINLKTGVPDRSATLLRDFPMKDQQVRRFYARSGFGLIGNKSGILLEPNFSDIRLIGTEDHEIIIGEQTLPQAGYKVLTYFNHLGEKLHSQAYRQDEYELVFCDE